MNRHTEGPWHIVPKDAPLTGDGLVCDLDTLSIRPRDGVKLGREQDDANLLAAAPELLEALEFALQQTGCDGDLCTEDWHEEARKAIAKAKGGD